VGQFAPDRCQRDDQAVSMMLKPHIGVQQQVSGSRQIRESAL
jgi:hypothetical protein